MAFYDVQSFHRNSGSTIKCLLNKENL